MIFLFNYIMPNPAKSYVCPKCLYETTLKKRMSCHFYNLKKPCCNETGIELTDEIKQYVLEHHKYIQPKPKKNYNLNNIVLQMDHSEKMSLLLNYYNKELLDFEDNLDNLFDYRVKRLELNQCLDYCLSNDDLLSIVDKVTKINIEKIEEFNIIFDKTIKRWHLYRGKEWESYLEDTGARELISLIKSYYLNTYEIYLIRNIYSNSATSVNRMKLREHLEIYYKFIACFNLTPIIIDYSDIDVVKFHINENNDYYLGETNMNLFSKLKNELKTTDIERTKRLVINIVKDNTTHNISQLNKAIISILTTDKTLCEQLAINKRIPAIENPIS